VIAWAQQQSHAPLTKAFDILLAPLQGGPSEIQRLGLAKDNGWR